MRFISKIKNYIYIFFNLSDIKQVFVNIIYRKRDYTNVNVYFNTYTNTCKLNVITENYNLFKYIL